MFQVRSIKLFWETTVRIVLLSLPQNMTKKCIIFSAKRTEKRLKGSLNKCTIWKFWLELHLKTERKKKVRNIAIWNCAVKIAFSTSSFSIYHLVSTWSEDTMHGKEEANHDEDSNIKQDARKSVEQSWRPDTLKTVHPHHNGCWWPGSGMRMGRIYYQKQKQIYQGPKEASASGLSSDQAIGVSSELQEVLGGGGKPSCNQGFLCVHFYQIPLGDKCLHFHDYSHFLFWGWPLILNMHSLLYLKIIKSSHWK